ncbi:hypothetical protein [Geomicrobium sp. JCM 19039]|uniref:hypothetical protein n=1 Tax=Geomicrobium sp. JCM 19039 TaxID=1460636 RepID=UPI00045F253D|nr:hypothetical protein [Geomicrobium sp. JCM 19039]GAK10581.1 hypothetical protein JCM19039_206 [Geomicrobium sp. JCM 19039]
MEKIKIWRRKNESISRTPLIGLIFISALLYGIRVIPIAIFAIPLADVLDILNTNFANDASSPLPAMLLPFTMLSFVIGLVFFVQI